MNYNKETDKIVQIKFNKDAYASLKAEAKTAGLTVSKYCKLCIAASRENNMITVQKIIKNTRKSDRLDIYTEDINKLADAVLGKDGESRGTKLDRLLYTESKYPDKFTELELAALQKEVEKLNQQEAEIIAQLKMILSKRKQTGNKWLKDTNIEA